ncbi:MAG: peptide ABC transporter substrate-binding protein, partial [Anaerolineae bacterium]
RQIEIPAFPVFKKINEEIMKNVIEVGQQLISPGDVPHIMIFFEGVSNYILTFIILLVRVNTGHELPLLELFRCAEPSAYFTLEWTRPLGRFRQGQLKEANLFRLQIPNDPLFLSFDSPLSFYRAREHVLSLIKLALGEVRDCNGGSTLKQGEQLSQLKHQFVEVDKKDPGFLEDFFYSLTPIDSQISLPFSALATLFKAFLEILEEKLSGAGSYALKFEENEHLIFVTIRTNDLSCQSHVFSECEKANFSKDILASAALNRQGSFSFGSIYNSSKEEEKKLFHKAIQQGIKAWQKSIMNQQVLKLSIKRSPSSLDPRLAGIDVSENMLRLLFEGLMRIGKDGIPACGVAENVSISEERTRYRFTIKKCHWNNGDPVTAYDFVHAWRSVFSPGFPPTFAYFFYPIKNARAIKNEKLPIDAFGVKALNEKCLEVELESPCSYFLELVSHPVYSPINVRIDQKHPNWPFSEGKAYVCNGPFEVKKSLLGERYEFVKNPLYWDAEKVCLDSVIFSQTSAGVALEMFKNNEIDWLGSPWRPWESAFASLSCEKVEQNAGPRVFWHVFNTQQFPFHHSKIRQALAYAIRQQDILVAFPDETSFILTPLPSAHTFHRGKGILDDNLKKAQLLFQEGLEALGLTVATFPEVTLIHAKNELCSKSAAMIKAWWEKILGIRCRLEEYRWDEVFNRMLEGNYQIGQMGWYASIDDPNYTLEAFRYKEDKINFAKWENEDYQRLLHAASFELNADQRRTYLAQAEEILLEQMPIIPIFNERAFYSRNNKINNLIFLKNGTIDLKYASIETHLTKTK